MRKSISYIIICVFLIMCIASPAPTVHASAVTASSTDAAGNRPPEINAKSAIVMDAKTGQVLYEKDAHSRYYPASITKIMTCYLALTKGNLDSVITMSDQAIWGIPRDSSHIALDVGEQITLRDALYAVMMVSANEAAWAVAEEISGSVSAFADLMNETAASLGCENTHFVNANGLHDENHYTTAYDMALITKKALENDTFREITAATYYEIPPTNLNDETRYLWQDNKLILEDSEYYYPACEGGKAGFTDEAQGTHVAWAKVGDTELICVILYAKPGLSKYPDIEALFDYCFDNYSYQQPFAGFTFDGEMLTTASNFLCDHYNCQNAGYMHLEIDTEATALFPSDIDIKALTYQFTPSAERLDENIIGTLAASYNGLIVDTQPVTYSGFIKSNDPAAIEEAEKDGTINPAYNASKKKTPWGLIIGGVVIVIGGTFVYARYRYVQEVRRRRRLAARRRNHERTR